LQQGLIISLDTATFILRQSKPLENMVFVDIRTKRSMSKQVIKASRW
jgi:hypothetical protein